MATAANAKWFTKVGELNQIFPISKVEQTALGAPLPGGAAAFPVLAKGLDDDVSDRLQKSLLRPAKVNGRRVEELLGDCINRISNCLILKEKAHEVEVRAISDALNHELQGASLEFNRSVQEIMKPIQHKLAANAIAADTNGGRTTYSSDEAVWEQIRAAQSAMDKAQKGVLDAQKLKASTPGNGSNYVERFALLKSLFDMGLEETYRRVVACSKALDLLYGIKVPVPDVTDTSYLNELAQWGQKASDELDAELDGRYTAEIAIAVSALDEAPKPTEILPLTQFTNFLNAGAITFSLTAAHFERFPMAQDSLLIRGLRVSARHKNEASLSARVWTGSIDLPDSDVTPGDELYPITITNQFQEVEMFRDVHNLRPIGKWSITLPERATTGETTKDDIKNLYLILRVSYRRK